MTGELYPWLHDTWRQTFEQIGLGRLPHALMVTGPAGLGKNRFAEVLANYLLCERRPETSACGACKSCLLINSGSHPDLLLIAPEQENKPIKIEQVRQLNHFAQQTSQQGQYKVIILTPGHALNINAANALLKNLEEPAASTLFILVSDQPDRISATIRSRCSQLAVTEPTVSDAQEWLAGKAVEADPVRLALLLKLAGNAPLKALELLQENKLEERNAVFKGMLRIQQGRLSALEVAQKWQPYELPDILRWMESLVSDLVKAALGIGEEFVQNSDIVPTIEKSGAQLSVDSLYLYLDRLQEMRQILLSGHNPNRILLLEDLLLCWSDCVRRRTPVCL